MKKISLFLLALVLVSSQAFAYTITKKTVERYDDAETGNSYVRVIGTLALDSSHPAEGEKLLPTQLGMASFTKVIVGPGSPPGTFTPLTNTAGNIPRQFAFDYTNSRVFVLSTQFVGGSGGYVGLVSGPVTYDLSYLTAVPFEAVGPIS